MPNPNLAGKLFSACIETAHAAKTRHVQAGTSGYHHETLGGFFDGLPPLADAFAEGFQGRYGLIGVFLDAEDFEQVPDEPAPIVRRLRDWIDANRAAICDATEIQNQIDEIVALCNATLYKLEFLS